MGPQLVQDNLALQQTTLSLLPRPSQVAQGMSSGVPPSPLETPISAWPGFRAPDFKSGA